IDLVARPRPARSGSPHPAFPLRRVARACRWLVPVVALWPAWARAQTVHTRLWRTDGTVYAVAHDAVHLYLGGQFSLVGPNAGGGAILDATAGTVPQGVPTVHGTVSAIASDGSGGWFLGGLFDRVGDEARQNLAHVLADRSVSPWDPGADGVVQALAV